MRRRRCVPLAMEWPVQMNQYCSYWLLLFLLPLFTFLFFYFYLLFSLLPSVLSLSPVPSCLRQWGHHPGSCAKWLQTHLCHLHSWADQTEVANQIGSSHRARDAWLGTYGYYVAFLQKTLWVYFVSSDLKKKKNCSSALAVMWCVLYKKMCMPFHSLCLHHKLLLIRKCFIWKGRQFFNLLSWSPAPLAKRF